MKKTKKPGTPVPWAELPALLAKMGVHYGEAVFCSAGQHEVEELEMWGFSPEGTDSWVPVRRKKCVKCRDAAFAKLTAHNKKKPTPIEVEKPAPSKDALAELLELAVVTGTYKGAAQSLKGLRSSQAWRSYYWSKEKLAQSEAEFRAKGVYT
jgi:hypothetical protein